MRRPSVGISYAGGGAMYVFQSVKCFELFTGIAPDAARMEKNFLDTVHQL